MSTKEQVLTKLRKMREDIINGTYQPEDPMPPSKSKIQLHAIQWGKDIKLDLRRKDENKPALLVVNPECLGFSRKDSLLRSIREMTVEAIAESGLRPRLGMYLPSEPRDFEIVPNPKPSARNATDLYIRPVIITLLALKDSKGNAAFRVPIDNTLESQMQKLTTEVDLIFQTISLTKVSPYFAKIKRNLEYDRAWIAKNNTL